MGAACGKHAGAVPCSGWDAVSGRAAQPNAGSSHVSVCVLPSLRLLIGKDCLLLKGSDA